MSDDRLTEEIARRVIGWTATSNRFVKSGRAWIPKWRFASLSRLDDAFQVLASSSSAYKIACTPDRSFSVEVKVGDRVGLASGEPIARTITLALARALGLEVEP